MKGWPGWVDLGGWSQSHTKINVPHRELNPDTVTHLSTNWTWHRITSLMCATSLPLSQAATLTTLPITFFINFVFYIYMYVHTYIQEYRIYIKCYQSQEVTKYCKLPAQCIVYIGCSQQLTTTKMQWKVSVKFWCKNWSFVLMLLAGGDALWHVFVCMEYGVSRQLVGTGADDQAHHNQEKIHKKANPYTK